jgi:hypothetical protein
LLAWPTRDRLYLVDVNGKIRRSRDGGRRWTLTGSIGVPPVAFTSGGSALYAALAEGTVMRSTDSGATWIARAAT